MWTKTTFLQFFSEAVQNSEFSMFREIAGYSRFSMFVATLIRLRISASATNKSEHDQVVHPLICTSPFHGPHLTCGSLGARESTHSKRHLNWFGSVSTAHSRDTSWHKRPVERSLDVGSCGQPVFGSWPYYPVTGLRPTTAHLVYAEPLSDRSWHLSCRFAPAGPVHIRIL